MLESQHIKTLLENIEKIENEIGSKLSDFEILQVLGKGSFGYVVKVRSKKDLKIYAMKKVDLSKVDESKKKYYENESIFLKKLIHPNICRLYSTFKENNNIYMIMEYADNGDLYSLLKAHKKLNQYIPEEKLWDILEQCLKGLVYIHSEGILHRDIKPANISYTSKGEYKITDFNVSSIIDKEKVTNFTNDENKQIEIINNNTQIGTNGFKAPEVNFSPYNDKADVYSLGATLCALAYQQISIPNGEPKLYSKELHDIIILMKSPPYKRPTSKEMYNKIIRLYIKKYLNMTGIVSCIICLSTYESLRNFFYNEFNSFNQEEKKIANQFNKILKALDQKKNIQKEDSTEDEFNYLLYEFRELLYFYGIQKKAENSVEIEPNNLIHFLLKKLHGELNIRNVKKGLEENCLKRFVKIENNIKQEVYDNYMIFYNSNYKSNISDNFYGMVKIKTICLQCNKSTYSFNMFSYISFKVEILETFYKKQNNLTILDAFNCLNESYVHLDTKKYVKCENCNIYTEHNKLKQFFNLPKNLIIFFDRGQNYEHKNFIDFPDILELDNKYVERFKGNIAYKLLGIICRVEDDHKKIKFLSFTKSGNNNNYINFEDKKQYNFENIKKCGIIIGLFYFCSYVKEHEMDNVVIDYLNNINNKNDNKENNNNENKNICIDNKNNSNNDDNLNDDEINTQIIFKKKKKSTCKNSINTTMNLLNQNNLNNNSNNSNVSSQNNNFKNIQNSLNNISNNSGYVQNNNFNNDQNNFNNSSNNSSGYFQNNNFINSQNNFNNNSNNSDNFNFNKFSQNIFNNSSNNSSGYALNNNSNNDQNNFNNSSNNSTGFSQNNYFNNGQNNFNYNSNNSINGCVQNNNINQISQNNFNTNSFNSSNNSSNGLVQNNDFNQFGQNNFNNNSNNSNNGFTQNNNINQFNQNNFNNNSNNGFIQNNNINQFDQTNFNNNSNNSFKGFTQVIFNNRFNQNNINTISNNNNQNNLKCFNNGFNQNMMFKSSY